MIAANIPKFVVLCFCTFLFTKSVSAQNSTPNFSCVNYTNDTIKLSDFKGKYVYVEFFASWCSTCKSEMKYLKKIYHEFKGDVIFLSISLDNNFDTFKTFMDRTGKKYKWTMVYAGQGSQTQKDYKVEFLPTFFLIDKEGNIINTEYNYPSEGIENIFRKIKGGEL